jgi:hypothetical protein
MLLVESLPDLSRELAELITAREPGLAAQIDELKIVAKMWLQ